MEKTTKKHTINTFSNAKKVYRMFLNNKKIYEQFLNNKISYNIENIEKMLNAEPILEKHKSYIKIDNSFLYFENIKESYQKQLTSNLTAILITFKTTDVKVIYLIKE